VRFAVLGDPVDHSLSPVIHRAAFAALDIEATYAARKVDAAGFVTAVAEVRYGTLTGANVTMPHKQLAFSTSERTSEAALRVGAVNTLLLSRGHVHGYNTDIDGIARAWEWNGLPDDRPVLVLGAGGAAAAAVAALADRDLFVSSRRPSAAVDLIDRTRVSAGTIPWGRGVAGAVVVNATPVGMAGESLPDAVLDDVAGLFELAYASGTTPAMRRVAAAGAPVAPGTDMLLAQAGVSFELWFDRAAPLAAMRAALDVETARRSDLRLQ
jgi:shikimate dehydrogenase